MQIMRKQHIYFTAQYTFSVSAILFLKMLGAIYRFFVFCFAALQHEIERVNSSVKTGHKPCTILTSPNLMSQKYCSLNLVSCCYIYIVSRHLRTVFL